jgi:HK97 family phage prohead protease
LEQRVLKMKDAKTREAEGKKYLEGYFAVFGESYKVWDGWVETIERGAFARVLATGNDVKVLWNHDSNIVLGSTGATTATLREDDTGLFGMVEINENDQDAVNAYYRIQRGDVDGCSFGFDIARQEDWWDDDGVYHTKILEVDPLYEVSPCTFPAYASTSISARSREQLQEAKNKYEEAREKKRSEWRDKMKKRLKGE